MALLLTIHSCRSQIEADINHVVHMGQSLGAGEHSLPVVTDSASQYGNLSFKIGTHTWTKRYYEGTPEERDTGLFSFIPLHAHERGHEGETIANGLCDHFSETAVSISNLSKSPVLLFSFSGQGGRLIRELNKRNDDAKDPRSGNRQSGGGYYKTAIDDIRRAKKRCDSLKLSYQVLALTWMQGESNSSGQLNRWDSPLKNDDSIRKIYIQDLIQLKNDFQEDAMNISGQQLRPHMFTYQTSFPLIGRAQLKATDLNPEIHMVAPTYMLPSALNSRVFGAHGDGIHLSADGERWLGEMFGKVIRKVMVDRKKWQPLRPEKAWFKDSNTVCVTFHTPKPPLVLDTSFLPKQGTAFGFEIYDSLKTYPIKNIRVVSDDLIEITPSMSLNKNKPLYVRYGHQNYVRELSQPIL